MPSRASLSRAASWVWLASLVSCAAALVLLSPIQCDAADNPLHVSVQKMADHVEITVIGRDPISCSRRQGVTFLALDVRGFAYPRAGRVKVLSGDIWQVRYGPFSANPQTVRVVVSTGSRRPYTTWFSEDKRRMVVKVYKRGYTPSGSSEDLATQSSPPDPGLSIMPASMVTGEQPVPSANPLQLAPSRSSAPRAKEAPVTVQPMANARGCDVAAQPERQPAPVRTASLSGGAPLTAAPETRVRGNSPAAARGATTEAIRKPLASGSRVVPEMPDAKLDAASEEPTKPTAPPRAASSQPDERSPRTAGDILKRSLQARVPVPPRRSPGLEQSHETSDERRNINLGFVSADINDVLTTLSKASKKNIVCGKDVSGQVTVQLENVSFPEALDYVTKLSGYRYAKSGDTYFVGTTAGLGSLLGRDERIVGTRTEVLALKVADVDEVAKAIATQVPDVKCSVGSYSAAGDEKKVRLAKVLMLSGPSDDVDVAKEIVAKVETSLSESRESDTTEVYRIKYSSPSSLLEMVSKLYPAVTATPGPSDGFELRAPVGTPIGSQSSMGSSQTGQPAGGEGEKDKIKTNMLVLSGPASDVKAALATLEQVDSKPSQILIEAKVTDLRVTLQKRLGLQWNWSSFGLVQRTGALDAVQNPVQVAGTFTHTPVTIKSVLDAFIENGDANLLANPRVAAVEGKPAEIFIGDEIRYVINVQQTVQGQNITTETATVGIQLRVIADVSPDGYITLNLHPEVSVVSDYIRIGTGAGGTDIVLPQIARRYTDSVIRVKNGETVVIGGLIRDQDLQTMRKVPFLGDIPFFGELFKRREKNKEHSEIVVFITCSIVED